MKKKQRLAGDEYNRFETALRKILSVPHSEMKSKLEAEKQKRTKKISVSHVSAAQD